LNPSATTYFFVILNSMHFNKRNTFFRVGCIGWRNPRPSKCQWKIQCVHLNWVDEFKYIELGSTLRCYIVFWCFHMQVVFIWKCFWIFWSTHGHFGQRFSHHQPTWVIWLCCSLNYCNIKKIQCYISIHIDLGSTCPICQHFRCTNWYCS